MPRTVVIWWAVAALTASAVALAATGATGSAGHDRAAAIAAQPPASAVDAPGDVVLDSARWRDGAVTLRGWAVDGGTVDVIVDGEVIAEVPAAEPRFDVGLAYSLSDDRVGFDVTVDAAEEPFLVCVASAGSVPATGACSRPVLDLDHHRAVALYGVPGVPVLGALGEGSARDARRRIEAQAAPYREADTPVVEVFEMLATVAQASPGRDGDYSEPVPIEDLREYLGEIRLIGGHVVLDFQPGRALFLDQIREIEELIIQPDVHVALDPEWDMLPGERPAQVVGHTPAAEINEVMAYLDTLVRRHRLPPKVVIVHQFQEQMIRDRPDLDPPPTVQLVLQMDGHGPPSLKTGNYRRLHDARFFGGFKLFYRRDVPLLGPADVLALDPQPEFVSYQ